MALCDSSFDSSHDEQDCYFDDEEKGDEADEEIVTPEEDEDENEKDVRLPIAVTSAVALAAANDS